MSNDLRTRLEQATRTINELIQERPEAAVRLKGKLEGVELALSYLNEERRLNGLVSKAAIEAAIEDSSHWYAGRPVRN